MASPIRYNIQLYKTFRWYNKKSMKTLLSQNSHKHFTALGSSELNWIPRSSKLGARQALEDKSKTIYSRAASAAAYVINSIIKFIVLCHFSQGFLDCQPNLRYHFCFSSSSLRDLKNVVISRKLCYKVWFGTFVLEIFLINMA